MVWIALGCIMVIISVLIHLGSMLFCFRVFGIASNQRWPLYSGWTKATGLASLVVLLVIASVIEAGLWALLYWMSGAIDSFQDAGYFSLVTYTTLGYGDITLDGNLRIVSAIEAANGTIMFGWTTAIIVMAVSQLYLKKYE